MAHAPLVVRLDFSASDAEFLDALGGLIAAIEHADPALLEDSVAAAHARLVAALRGLRFEAGA